MRHDNRPGQTLVPDADNETRACGQTARGSHALIIVVILLSSLLVTGDMAMLNAALPTISTSLNVSASSSIWVINAYNITVVGALLPFAALSEVVGHKRIFLGGLGLFTVGALLCGLVSSFEWLVVARAILGLGAAAVVSVNIALIRLLLPMSMLGRGIGLNAMVVSIAFIISPLFAALVISTAGWEFMFFSVVPLGLLACALAAYVLPTTEVSVRQPDLLSCLLCAMFIAPMILGLGNLTQGRPAAAGVCLVVALVFCIALLRRQRGRPGPIFPTDLYRIPVFALSSLTSTLAFAAQGLAFVSLPFLFKDVLRFDPFLLGVLLTPWPLAVAMMALVTGRLPARLSPGMLGCVGMSLLACALLLLSALVGGATPWAIGATLFLCGLGFGLFQAPNMRALMSSGPRHRSGSASGVVAVSRMFGQAIGTALVAACFFVSAVSGPVYALVLAAGFAILAALSSVFRLRFADRSAH